MNKAQFKFLLSAISDNESRRNLMFLEFKVLNGFCTITAANAFLIKRIRIDCDLPDGDYYLELKQVKKLLKISTNYDEIALTLPGVEVDGVTLKWENEDFDYPNLDNLITGTYGPCNKVLGFNNKYMVDALKDAPDDVFKMDFKETNSSYSLEGPCRITFKSEPDWLIILMPIRIQW